MTQFERFIVLAVLGVAGILVFAFVILKGA